MNSTKPKSKKKDITSKFKLGDVITFAPENFTGTYWKNLSNADKIKYYGPLGYGQKKLKLFVYLTAILDAPGHCVLVDIDTGLIECMRHDSDFRKVTEDEI